MIFFVKSISLWIVLILIGFTTGETYLRFIPILNPNDAHESFDIPSGFKDIEVDAFSPFQTTVRILEHLNTLPTLKFHCRVAKLDEGATLTYSTLCRRRAISSPEVCMSTDSGRLIFEQVEFHAIGDNSQGYTFASTLAVANSLLDGFYYCKLGNGNGKLESNMMEIQDIGFYHKIMVRQKIARYSFLPTLTAASLPKQIDCGDSRNSEHLPDWADAAFPSPFQWALCTFSRGEDMYNCLQKVRKSPLRVSEYLENAVMPNGSLILFTRTSATWTALALICFSYIDSSNVFSIYYGGSEDNRQEILYDESVRYPRGSGINPLSPTEQSLTVRSGTRDFQLTAVYRANPQTTKYVWKKDQVRIPPDFKSLTPFVLGFPSPVNRNHSGVYTLYLSDSDTGARLTMSYTVSVVGPPVVRKRPPSRVIVVEGARFSFSCELLYQQTTKLEINGIEVSPSPDSQLEELLQQFPYLKEVELQPLKFSGPVIQYSVGNLFFRPGFPSGPSHLVTIIGANSYGEIRLSTQITVLRKPNLLLPPKNCTGDRCLSNARQHFICQFDMEPYRSLLDVVQVNQTWELDDTDLASLEENRAAQAAYLEVSGNQLFLKPVDPVHVPLFQDSQVTCRLRIYVIRGDARLSGQSNLAASGSFSAGVGELGSTSSVGQSLIYDSKEDVLLRPQLTVMVQLKLVDEPTAKASISWIAAVLIAAMILVIVAALIAFIVMRNRGQTYLLDREERALGNDPVKEYREKEGFRTYERADEPPLCGSRYSGNDGSAEIGSDADGELDGYSIDPGKFNEDGSFIDQYATDTPYKNHARLPLLPRTYDPQV